MIVQKLNFGYKLSLLKIDKTIKNVFKLKNDEKIKKIC